MGDWVIVGLLAVKARGLAVRLYGEERVVTIETSDGWFS